MKHLLSIILICFISQFGISQITFYATYADYINNKGKLYKGDLEEFSRNNLKIRQDGKVVKIAIDETYWGFDYQERLFRNNMDKSYVLVMRVGENFCYYENGEVHLAMITQGVVIPQESLIGLAFLSRDLESPIVRLYRTDRSNAVIKEFRNKYPEVNDFFICEEGKKPNEFRFSVGMECAAKTGGETYAPERVLEALELEKFVGKYEEQYGGFIIEITIKENELMFKSNAHFTYGNNYYDQDFKVESILAPITELCFSHLNAGAMVYFHCEDDVVTGLTLYSIDSFLFKRIEE